MSRTDNTMPELLLKADRPTLPWKRILNTSTNHGRRARREKHAHSRRYWSGERYRVRLRLRDGDEAPGRQTAYRVREDLW